MKSIYILFSLLITGILMSCDDGDIILDEGFNFNTNNLQLCNTGSIENNSQSNAVFFNINTDTDEVLVFQLNNRFYDATRESTFESGEEFAVENVNLSLFDFDSDITAAFFCSGIPDTSVNLISELVGDRGTITVTTRSITTLDGDDDNDGLSNEEEFFGETSVQLETLPDNTLVVGSDLSVFRDTDEDGIPDFRDFDDDNDNVPTSFELRDDDETTEENENNTPMDTDGDGIPDHLDDDDDNDGLITRNEVSESDDNLVPTAPINQNADGVPNYLNPAVTTTIDDLTRLSLLVHRHNRTFRTTVLGRSIGFSNGDTTISREILPFGELDANSNIEDTLQIQTPEVIEEEMTPTGDETTTVTTP